MAEQEIKRTVAALVVLLAVAASVAFAATAAEVIVVTAKGRFLFTGR